LKRNNYDSKKLFFYFLILKVQILLSDTVNYIKLIFPVEIYLCRKRNQSENIISLIVSSKTANWELFTYLGKVMIIHGIDSNHKTCISPIFNDVNENRGNTCFMIDSNHKTCISPIFIYVIETTTV